jgi:hypothetical protein
MNPTYANWTSSLVRSGAAVCPDRYGWGSDPPPTKHVLDPWSDMVQGYHITTRFQAYPLSRQRSDPDTWLGKSGRCLTSDL